MQGELRSRGFMFNDMPRIGLAWKNSVGMAAMPGEGAGEGAGTGRR